MAVLGVAWAEEWGCTGMSAKLQQEDFIEAAFGLAQDSGVHGFTMRSLGEKMGLDPTTVYRYFKSKDALVVAMVGRTLASRITPEMLETPPRQRIMLIACAARAALLENPEMAAALANATGSAETLAASEVVVDALEQMGLTGRSLVVWYQLIEGIVIGGVLLDSGGAPQNWESRGDRYRTLGVRPFTEVAKAGPDEVEAVGDEAVMLGLSTVLDAIEASVG